MQQAFEERFSVLEERLASSEQTVVMTDKKGQTNQSIIADIVDKVESKVLALEQ